MSVALFADSEALRSWWIGFDSARSDLLSGDIVDGGTDRAIFL
jgi:hypothetical protein